MSAQTAISLTLTSCRAWISCPHNKSSPYVGDPQEPSYHHGLRSSPTPKVLCGSTQASPFAPSRHLSVRKLKNLLRQPCLFLQFLGNLREEERASSTPGGGNFYASQIYGVGRRLGAEVIRAAREGQLSYTEAYELTGLYGVTFEQFRAAAGARRSGPVTARERYLPDTNVFVEAACQHYAFSLAPGFWSSLVVYARQGLVRSIDRVREELVRGHDDVSRWSEQEFAGAFESTDDAKVFQAYRDI
jgi:hypothetical protein